MEQYLNFKTQSVFLKIEEHCFFQLHSYFSKKNKKFIITDHKIPKIYVENLKQQLQAKVFVFRSGEKSKNLQTIKKIINFLQKNGCNKSDQLIALGGGVCIDITGFVASIYKRGIAYASIPTSTLAMVDSCIGGKTGVDFAKIKNMVGTIYHPSHIFIDISLLKTLPTRHFYNGLIEALKMGVIYDKALYQLFCCKNWNLNQIISTSILDKVQIVLQDEQDKNERQILNFGHSIGHAIESFYRFRLLHGEAVGNGMLAEIQDENIKKELQKILVEKFSLPIRSVSYKQLKKYLLQDKKIQNDTLVMYRVTEIGHAEKVNVSLKEWFHV